MSFKSSLKKQTVKIAPKIIKIGAKLTPKKLVSMVANVLFKGIANFSTITYDLDAKTAFVKVTLYGEEEPIELALDGFEIQGEEGNYQFILHNAESSKPWLNNIFARIVGKAIDIPDIPKYNLQLEIVANLLKAENAEKEADNSEPEVVDSKKEVVDPETELVKSEEKVVHPEPELVKSGQIIAPPEPELVK